jgi:hypothetical protein
MAPSTVAAKLLPAATTRLLRAARSTGSAAKSF